jgi:hypothetical protein
MSTVTFRIYDFISTQPKQVAHHFQFLLRKFEVHTGAASTIIINSDP